MDSLVKAVESGNYLLLVLVGVFGGLWFTDKVLFYVSKFRNNIPLAHARTGSLDTILRRTSENTAMLRANAVATSDMGRSLAHMTDRWEKDRDDIRAAHQSISESCARMERHLERE